MLKHLLSSALVVSAVSLLGSGCGAPPEGALAVTSNGVVQTRGADGVLRRTSSGRDGYIRDLAYFRQRLQDLEASPRADRELTAGVARLVTKLEQLRVGSPRPMTVQDCGASDYTLTASVDPGVYYGTATAGASYTEFGPPSPWSKTLYDYAYASSTAGTHGDSHTDTFSGVGTFSIPDASAQTGPAGCKRLIAFASITANGCSGGYDSVTEDWDPCN